PAGGALDSERNGHEYNGSDPLGRDVAPGFSDPKIYNNIIRDNWYLHYDQPAGETDEEDLDYTWGRNYVWTRDDLHVDNPALRPAWESHLNSESFSHVEYNVIADGTYAGRPGNTAADPQFAAPTTFLFPADSGTPLMTPGADWRLLPGSPVIDQAPIVPGLRTDLDTHPRSPHGGMFDMGAYEYQWPNPASITIVKNANPANGAEFTFHGDLGGFTLSSVTNTLTFAGLVSGSYVITEAIPAGWSLSNASCGGSFSPVTGTTAGLIGVAMNLQQNQVVTCTFTNELKPVLTVTKIVLPASDAGRFNLQIDGASVVTGVGDGGSTGAVTVTVGSHTVAETAATGTTLANYSASTGGDCNPDGSITLAAGDNGTCVITNVRKPALTLVNTVVNDDGGTATPGDFTLYISGTVVSSGQTVPLKAGVVYTAGQTGPPGYAPSAWGGDCNPDGSISLSLGQDATCTITNDDVAPTLTVMKVLLPASDAGLFNLQIDGSSVVTGVGDGGSTGAVAVTAGSHTVTETAATGTALADYSASTGGDCNPDGSISLGLGQDATCVITNVRKSALTLVNTVVNDDGGTATP
ncbi:MAG: choice-of-anchor Q domain-containing protein, partial [Anaerolineae bacterium]